MTANELLGVFGARKPVIGMLHAPPLPGSPGFAGERDGPLHWVLRDADALAAGGVHALMLENFGDAPFLKGRVPAFVVAHLTRLAENVRRRFPLPLGINVLRNDGVSAIDIAHAVGAAFVRVNVFCGARVTDQGVIEGVAAEMVRERALLNAGNIRILADVSVKHSAPLGPERPIEDEVDDVLHRGRADVLVVSGAATGKAARLDFVKRVKAAAGAAPVLLGSGVSAATIGELLPVADGFIVGTSLKVEGRSENPVDPGQVSELIRAAAFGGA